MRRIIVEGADGTGKTTLIEYLMNQFHFLRLIVNTLGPQQNFNTWWPLQLAQNTPPEVPIHDRFFYSELVYGPLFRGYLAASQGVISGVRFRLREEALLIYANTREPILDKNPQMEGVIDNHLSVERAYEKLMQSERDFYPAGRFYMYDWTEPDALHRVEAIVERYLDLYPNDHRSDPSSIGGGS